MDELIERLRLLEQDHEPDGWPAVRMRDITALLDALEAAREDAADAARYRWLCDGNGYFMEEAGLCHINNEKPEADAAIDKAMRGEW